jgi:MFS family permease
VLWLMVPRHVSHHAPPPGTSRSVPSMRAAFRLCAKPRFRMLLLCAAFLSLATVSDGFIYLLLQKRTDTPANMLPLFYVGTAGFYMLFSLPVGLLADRWGRHKVMVGGFAMLPLIYIGLLTGPILGAFDVLLAVALMGLFYAGTEGLLIAMGSQLVPPEVRTSGIALIGTAIGLGKMGSSVLFGWIWSRSGVEVAMLSFCLAMIAILSVTARRLRGFSLETSHV